MTRCDALIVGGGPAGSTCARALRLAGWNVIVVDRARFPRDKVCAGWLTPHVFRAIDLEPADYKATGLTLQEITSFRTGLIGRRLVETQYGAVVSYAIRRCEFDTFLLRRAGVSLREGTSVGTLERKNGSWIVNGEIEALVLIGAGGHFCPVARHISSASEKSQPVVAKEAEFKLGGTDAQRVSETPELLFCQDLDGYGWCVRKGDYLNVGIGRRGNGDFSSHVRSFMEFLSSTGRAPKVDEPKWRGHAYHAAGVGPRPLISDGLLLVGDAAGLAYPESGEGIRPAVESGRLAADVLIRAGGRHAADDLQPYAEGIRRMHPPAARTRGVSRALTTSIGRLLMQSPAFTRHVLLNRWFLRSSES